MNRALPDPDEEPTVTAGRWAAILGVSTRAVLYAVERGEIPAVRVGRRVVILTARALAQSGLAPNKSEAVPATGTATASILKDTNREQRNRRHAA
jgi:excisionase family DNA binding protein